MKVIKIQKQRAEDDEGYSYLTLEHFHVNNNETIELLLRVSPVRNEM